MGSPPQGGRGVFPWPAGAATGAGSHPGEDLAAALRTVLDELPDLPYLPELPARGPGADMTGRAAAMLVDLAVELWPSGWRFADRPGRDTTRARSFLARDLDALEEHAGAFEGPLKIQIAGPWSLAGTVELRHGDRALADPGAVRDLTASLAEGIAAHIAEVRRRVPRTTILLQLDEPGLPSVLAGTVPTASGFGRLPAVDAHLVEDGLRRVIDAVDAFPIVHCCAPDVPYGMLRAAGARAISVDVSLIRDEDAVGEAVEAGTGLLLGVIRGTDTRLPAPKVSAAPVLDLWHRLGLEAPAETVVVTPACGLAGSRPQYARAALKHCGETARVLAEA